MWVWGLLSRRLSLETLRLVNENMHTFLIYLSHRLKTKGAKLKAERKACGWMGSLIHIRPQVFLLTSYRTLTQSLIQDPPLSEASCSMI